VCVELGGNIGGRFLMTRLSILGLTFQFITSRIPRDRYNTYHAIYLDEVARMNPIENLSGPLLQHPDDNRIRTSEELRFSLFRHWNLYDSMYHSGYVAGKLGIWQERGRKKLQGLLAKMGFVEINIIAHLLHFLSFRRFSLQQCHQTFQHMDIDLKKKLRRQMDTMAPEYGLVDLAYPSFVRSFGFRSQPLCAADVVEGVSALIQAAGGIRLEVENPGDQGGGEWFGGTHIWNLGGKARAENHGATTESWKLQRSAVGVDDAPDGEDLMVDKWWARNFWVALDALGAE
jgi:cell division control protein 45